MTTIPRIPKRDEIFLAYDRGDNEAAYELIGKLTARLFRLVAYRAVKQVQAGRFERTEVVLDLYGIEGNLTVAAKARIDQHMKDAESFLYRRGFGSCLRINIIDYIDGSPYRPAQVRYLFEPWAKPTAPM